MEVVTLKNHSGPPRESSVFRSVFVRMIEATQFHKVPVGTETSTNVLFKNDTYMITYTGDLFRALVSHAYAVPDPVDEHRVLICIGMSDYGNMDLAGVFVYFDGPHGNARSRKIINCSLGTFDVRNGRPRTFLYNQTVLTVVIHRDTRSYLFHVSCFDYHDHFVGGAQYYTGIQAASHHVPFESFEHRLLLLPGSENNHLFDLGSVENIEDKTCYSLYKLNGSVGVQEVVDQIKHQIPQKPYGDEYIDGCVRCGSRAVSGLYAYNVSSCTWSSQGLGRSYCHPCGIRWSLSDRVWMCCKKKRDSMQLCFATVSADTNYTCGLEHDTPDSLVFHTTATELTKPYKQTGTLSPSSEAR